MAIGSMTTNSTVDMIDKTLAIPGAPADAAAVGNIILDFTKETPQPIFYSKAEVDKLLEDCKEAAKGSALLAANPVGKLWASDDPTSPASIVGGTWERIKDCFILAAGDTYAAGSTGGEATHKLTINEIPAHYHDILIDYKNANGLDASNYKIVLLTTAFKSSKTDTARYLSGGSTYVGSSQPHNNMPPYISMYVWKRIA